MDYIIRTEFGSIVYGTNLPTSDTDYKAIIIPTKEEILLQKAPKTIQCNTKKDSKEKNTKDDIDEEIFSLHYYLKLLSEGQTPAIDLLFTPEKHWTHSSKTWEIIRENKNKIVNNGISAFVGYTRTQAAKYGIKGTRVAALRIALDVLKQYDQNKKLHEIIIDGLQVVFHPSHNEYLNIVNINGPNGSLEPHLEVCNRKIPFHATVKYAVSVFQKIFDEYGHRALAAEQNLGVDYKALYHAVRVGKEAEELLLTGNITFPRPEAPLLLDIRQGKLPYKEVAEIIEQGLYNIEQAQLKSILPKQSDQEFINNLIIDVYGDKIRS